PALHAALDGDAAADDEQVPDEPKVESALSPKEIQSRLRAGQSLNRVAKAAGVPVDWVGRFYGPVLTERAQVMDEVRSARIHRPRRGESGAPLGEAVREHLDARAREAFDDPRSWSAFRREDGTWVVRLRVTVRGRDKTISWSWDPVAKSVAALDSYAGTLAYVEPPPPPARRRRGAGSRATTTTARKTTARKTTARKTTARKTTARKGGVRKTSGRRA
ncbi:MAG: septation protein SepH, partial [Mycobacteriales bacterium]